jgi:tRNA (guanine10-N2)-methyltransferase
MYLLSFGGDTTWNNFRLAEFDCLLKTQGGSYLGTNVGIFIGESTRIDYLIVELPSPEAAIEICKKSMLVKSIYTLWSMAESIEELVTNMKQLPLNVKFPHMNDASLSWSISIDSLCKSYTQDEQAACRDKFRFMDVAGPIKLDSPDISLHIILDYQNETICELENKDEEETDNSNVTRKVVKHKFKLKACYFGELVATNNIPRELIKKYDLKKRLYLGPTSLDTTLTFLIANFANVKKGDFVLDPFVGTGSILIAMAHYGAICYGFDIDIRVLRGDMYAGKKDALNIQKRDIFENFKCYKLSPPELMRMDNHLLNRHLNFSCVNEMFNIIVTDPPYGIRAGAKKSGRNNVVNYTVDPARRQDHIPATQHYNVNEVMLDLLHTAASLLVIEGKLIYILPTPYLFDVEDLPQHPCLELNYLCHQPLSSRHGRQIVVMTKKCSYAPSRQAEFIEYKKLVCDGLDKKFGTLMNRLEEALAADAFENEQVVKHFSKKAKKRRDYKIKCQKFHSEKEEL